MDDKLRRLLLRSFDDKLDPKDRMRLEEALKSSSELREEKERLMALRLNISESRAAGFGPGFADRVMGRIAAPAPQENGLESLYDTFRRMFQKFALAGAVALLVLVTYNLSIGDSLSEEEIFFASDTTYQELQDLSLF